MKKIIVVMMMFALSALLMACDNEANGGYAIESEIDLAAETQVLNEVAVHVEAHENHDDEHDDDHEGEEGIGDTHHFHFAIDVDGSISYELHGTSSTHFELKLTPMGGYEWEDDVTLVINLPTLIEGSEVTHYIDDHGCLVIIVEFPS